MATRASSRVYSPGALETWFANVALNWEDFFSEEVLEQGRTLYRDGLISGIELADADAIVHCSFSRKDTCYAVIEWGREGPKVRASTDDDKLGRAVAAGGLYEIEELIADEITPLPFVPDPEAVEPDAEEGLAASGQPASEEIAPPDARSLALRLEGQRQGLRLVAHWVGERGKKEPAFRETERPLAEVEREALVRLTGHAREAGFIFRKESDDFLLPEVDRIEPFLAHSLSRWQEVFGALELDSEASRMAEGIRTVKLVGRAESTNQRSMRVDWRLKLGRRWLDDEDAERLARSGRGVHIVRGLGLVRIGEAESSALEEWHVAGSISGREAKEWPRYMIFSLFGDRGTNIDFSAELRKWTDSLKDVVVDRVGEAELPRFLRDYQADGVRWMANLSRHGCHGLLADEMGLGKTLQVLTLIHRFPIEGRSNLIVCPASVVPVWESEAAHWYPEMNTKILRSGDVFSDMDSEPSTLWIASYTQLRRHKHLLDDFTFGYAVLDEAQQIKNPDAKVTHACCAIRAECRFALTGTPLENRLLDLWTIFRFLMPGLLGGRRHFEDSLDQIAADERAAFESRLRKQIQPFLLRRLKDSVGRDLPPKVEMDLVCPITELQRQNYEALLSAGRSEMGDDLQKAMEVSAVHFFTLLTRLRQVCCDPGLLPGLDTDIGQSGKVQTLVTCLQEALGSSGTRKIVVFSQFVRLLKRLKPLLKREFPSLSLFELTGETRDRAKPVAAFQESKEPSLILVSLRAGGTGITLHAADYVFLLDPWWNPAVEDQAVDRVHRIGQEHRVFVYRMITQGTVEARIQHLKKEKRALFENTLGALGGAKDLREHFADLQDLAKLLPPEPGPSP